MSERTGRLCRAALWAICSVGGLSACVSNNPAPVTFYNAGRLTNAYSGGAGVTGTTAATAPAPVEPGVRRIVTPRVERQNLDVEATSLPPPGEYGRENPVVPAPEGSLGRPAPRALVIVKPGDTLYSIARITGVDRNALAAENDLAPPYTLKVGARLKLPPPHTQAGALFSSGATGGPLLGVGQYPPPPASAPTRIDAMPEYVAIPPSGRGFVWPVKGRIVADFGLQKQGRTNDGIDIAVPEGTNVVAARAGEIIYTGNELKGYGNLVLIQHEDGYVSAYAHNRKLLVHRGDYVRQGQRIAESGRTGNVDMAVVHFEIRKDRKPVNPQAHLPRI